MTRDEIETLRRGDVFYRADEVDGVVRVYEFKLDCPKLTQLQLHGGHTERGEAGQSRLVSYGLPATVQIRRARFRGEPTDGGSVERVSASDLARCARTADEAAKLYVQDRYRDYERARAEVDRAFRARVEARRWQLAWETGAREVW